MPGCHTRKKKRKKKIGKESCGVKVKFYTLSHENQEANGTLIIMVHVHCMNIYLYSSKECREILLLSLCSSLANTRIDR